ncbi:MAG: leucine--tRNA ligase [Thaumarchaeota archaeon]|nr:leucine--tRNA ligase [Nitrososphaerota archaeon]
MANYEKYWLKAWSDRHIFEPDPIVRKKKIFVTFPYPYMQGPLHIGHCFTATRCDIYARFKRMQGYNVLFPWAWHWTGESIVGQSYRLSQGDKAVRRAFIEIDRVPEKEVEKFTDPEYLASYYTRVSRDAVRETGFSVDWRREFTTVNPPYKKFIEWQYLRLRELGYVVQGTHPVVWCEHDESPTGDHDRLEGEGVAPEEFNLVKFPMDGRWLAAGTLRPETIFGTTNIWLNPDKEYSEVKINGQSWVISSSAAKRLSQQLRSVEQVRSFKGSELIGQSAKNPWTGAQLPILPSSFVDTDLATGVVYSVPAHAPYDYIGLVDIQSGRMKVSREIKEAADRIRPISIISIQGYSDFPAEDAVKRMGIKDSSDPKLEDATNEVYKAEFHRGVMRENCDTFRGLKVSEAKDAIIKQMKEKGWLDAMFELPQRVVCKCGTRCFVKILENQWFLNYSDEGWKNRTKQLVSEANVFPRESESWYFSTIDWLRNWPCARRAGMGTKLPWDKEWIVETLSDSTIYMAFYTINHYINAGKVGTEQLSPELFDYIFHGKGSASHVSRSSGIDAKLVSAMRNEFLYWYPVDLRNSAKELIPNHLTFFAFHHAALFGKEQWPRGFSVNGMIQIEGQKMSKSRAIFVTWREALEEYGADALRATLSLAADGMDDADWKTKNAEDMRDKVDSLFPFIEKSLKDSAKRQPEHLDRWLFSIINGRILAVTSSMEEMKIRRALSIALLDVWNDVRWYLRRSRNPRRQTLSTVFEAWIRLLSPFTPFAAEELNRMMGNKGLVSIADWPSGKDFQVDQAAEISELLLAEVIGDARNLLKVIKEPKKRLNVYVSSDSASKFFFEMVRASVGDGKKGDVIKKFSTVGIKPERILKLQHELGDDLTKKLLSIPKFDEFSILSAAAGFLSVEIGMEVYVFKAGEKGIHDPANKAKDALPFKPAFFLE